MNPLMMLAMAACAPRYADLGPLPPAELWSPLPYKHVEINGVDVAYVDSGGDGPPLVFVHGLSSYTAYWEYQLPHFAKKYRVLALDLPGYGASGRPDAACTPPWYADLVSDQEVASRIYGRIETEYRGAADAVCRVTGQTALLERSPVLGTSIERRNPYVDPLSFIQLVLLRRIRANEEPREELITAVLESINGVASGLKNTG